MSTSFMELAFRRFRATGPGRAGSGARFPAHPADGGGSAARSPREFNARAMPKLAAAVSCVSSASSTWYSRSDSRGLLVGGEALAELACAACCRAARSGAARDRRRSLPARCSASSSHLASLRSASGSQPPSSPIVLQRLHRLRRACPFRSSALREHDVRAAFEREVGEDLDGLAARASMVCRPVLLVARPRGAPSSRASTASDP